MFSLVPRLPPTKKQQNCGNEAKKCLFCVFVYTVAIFLSTHNLCMFVHVVASSQVSTPLRSTVPKKTKNEGVETGNEAMLVVLLNGMKRYSLF